MNIKMVNRSEGIVQINIGKSQLPKTNKFRGEVKCKRPNNRPKY